MSKASIITILISLALAAWVWHETVREGEE